jgi:hypothetical protein
MFTLPSLPKLLILAAIVAVVWYFLRRNKVGKTGQDESRQNRPSGGKGAASNPIEDMVQCKSCGAYYPAKSSCSCGHSQG